MLKAFLNWLTGKPNSQPTQPEVAPYKVETPVVSEPQPIKCGCGRSLSGYCIGLHKLSQVEWDAHEDNPNRPTVAPEPAPVAESVVPARAAKPAAKKPAPAKKAAAAKPAPAKKPAAKPAAIKGRAPARKK